MCFFCDLTLTLKMYIFLIYIQTTRSDKYPWFIMGLLAWAKTRDEQFWNIEISCSQWEDSTCTQNVLFNEKESFGSGDRARIFSFFLCSQNVLLKFSMGSHQVPKMFPMFPMCFPRVFPIPSCFNPICFAQSRPLLTYIGGPKGETLHLFIESSILGSLHSFNFSFSWANQIGSQQKRRRVGLVRHPQLINMKQKKVPPIYNEKRAQYQKPSIYTHNTDGWL